MSGSLLTSLTYLGHNYMFVSDLTDVFSDNNSSYILTVIDGTYSSDTISGIIEGENFISFYSYDYYIYYNKISGVLKFGLKMIWNLIRQIYEGLPLINYILWKEKSFLIHAAAFEMDSNAFLFLGESGAGKTTFSKLAYNRNINILSDELVAIQFDDTPVVWGTYVHSDDFNFWDKNSVSRPFPLAACFVLVQSTQSKIVPIINIDKVELFNKHTRNYIYRIYPIEKLLSMIINFKFYYLEFEKENFEFELLEFSWNNNKAIVDQIINTRPLLFAEVKKAMEDENTKQIKISEVKRDKLYFLRINKEIKKIKFKSYFLIGMYNNIDLEKLVPFLPDVCSFISYLQVNGLPYMGRKKLFSLTKSIDLDRIKINRIKKLKGTTQIEFIKAMFVGVELEKCPLYEQYIVSQIKGINADMLDLYDFWGLYDNANLVSLIRVDNEIATSSVPVRSIGIVYTKNECRHRGYATNLIAFVMKQYDERSIWRYESEENNLPSCNFAQNFGFSYEGDTFFYEYKSK